jgi:hypothetical protein
MASSSVSTKMISECLLRDGVLMGGVRLWPRQFPTCRLSAGGFLLEAI